MAGRLGIGGLEEARTFFPVIPGSADLIPD